MMNVLAEAGKHFYGIFQKGAEFLIMYLEEFLPVILLLIVLINIIKSLMGKQQIEKLLRLTEKNPVTRWLLLPFLAVILLGSPEFYKPAVLLDQGDKAAYIDAVASFSHPATGLFPGAHTKELFIFLGIAAGAYMAGYDVSFLALTYFIIGVSVTLVRALITRIIVVILTRQQKDKEV
ncbi:PTS glucitol/sorbitol transporter subunit IIC [Eubacteriaceae bacterium ES2]|nr:PTS glucitol/sorbitol transporter subunit IIC [Eubacteriaceae bacterium ES2]